MRRYFNILKNCIFILTILYSIPTIGQTKFKLIKLEANKLPKNIKYEGKIKTAIRWTDKSGDNIVITTETGVKTSKKEEPSDDFREAKLFAYHFLISNDTAKLTWRVYDFIKDCSFDIETNFIKNTSKITDLNNDGIAEIWLMYKTGCRSDVSPNNMKIIMYQGLNKFAMRGIERVFVGIDEKGYKNYIGGEYKFDQAFTSGPKEFLEFAKKLWLTNMIET